ncbi:MAG: dNTP triphosphohydrolase [bacterium]|nr:dNTP triphosphohydrolase [bacterium]
MREVVEDRERQTLAPYAAFSNRAERRFPDSPEEESGRSAYQLDRDRILYSTAFRRLQYKTQVYVLHEGDFYRTRLTHTLEVMQIARTLARSLGCNEDLAEAIALAHDLGHPPFGHAGEQELGALVGGGFDHNLQGLRIVDELELRYPSFPGLNLTYETREGLARHVTDYDNPRVPPEFAVHHQPSLEAQIVNLADQIAFCTHDLDDALVGGMTSLAELRAQGIPMVAGAERLAREEIRRSPPADPRVLGRRVIRHLIHTLIQDATRWSGENLKGVSSLPEVRECASTMIGLPSGLTGDFAALKSFLMERVYRSHLVQVMNHKGRLIVRGLFRAFLDHPELLHPLTRALWEADDSEAARARVVADYVCGMTDSFAMNMYTAIFEPEGRALHLVMQRAPFGEGGSDVD